MDMSFPAPTVIMSNTVAREQHVVATSLVNTVVTYCVSIGRGIAATVEVHMDEGEQQLLVEYRASWSTGIGFAGFGNVYCPCIPGKELFFGRRREDTSPAPATEQEMERRKEREFEKESAGPERRRRRRRNFKKCQGDGTDQCGAEGEARGGFLSGDMREQPLSLQVTGAMEIRRSRFRYRGPLVSRKQRAENTAQVRVREIGWTL